MLVVIGYLLFIAYPVLLVLAVWAPEKGEDKVALGAFTFLFGFLLLFAPGVVLGPGLFPNYGDTVRDGYLVRASVSGLVYRTCELEVVTGFGGDAASLAHGFSAPETYCATVEPLIGKQVRVEANLWLTAPVRYGNSDAIVERITLK